ARSSEPFRAIATAVLSAWHMIAPYRAGDRKLWVRVLKIIRRFLGGSFSNRSSARRVRPARGNTFSPRTVGWWSECTSARPLHFSYRYVPVYLTRNHVRRRVSMNLVRTTAGFGLAAMLALSVAAFWKFWRSRHTH